MKKKILFISMCLPFEKVMHAGGRTFHYYINCFANDIENEVTLISKVLPDEVNYISTLNPRIRTLLVATPKSRLKKYKCYIKSLNSKFNPNYPYGNVLTKEIYDQIENRLKQLVEECYNPQIIILEWTWIALFIDVVKKYFPSACYVASEHDVSFLGFERLAKQSNNLFKCFIAKLRYKNIKNRELNALHKFNYVVTHSEKDRKILLDNGMPKEKVGVIVPFFDIQNVLERDPNNRDIIFFGAMNRKENWMSALWFINNVMPLLNDINIRFIVIGNKPPRELKKEENDNVIVTGYVEDIDQYFSAALCCVAPLQMGAGIKVKILETISRGVPVLTNHIGIEGIDMLDGEHYFHCEKPDEYANTIRAIVQGRLNAEEVAKNARLNLLSNYNFEKSFMKYSEIIYNLK